MEIKIAKEYVKLKGGEVDLLTGLLNINQIKYIGFDIQFRSRFPRIPKGGNEDNEVILIRQLLKF